MEAAAPKTEARLDLSRLLDPRGIAVVGASQELSRIGGQPVRNLTNLGYPGKVFPVNPKYREIAGLRCFPDVASVPQPCDLAVIAVAARLVPGIIERCAMAGIRFAVILSSGFGEMGEQGTELQGELQAAIRKSGVRVVGPNCVGVLNLKSRMYCGMGTGFQDPKLKPGPIAMVTQSGGMGFSIVTLAEREGVGFNYVISSGNEIDITTPDILGYFLERDDIEIVASYIEGVSDGRELLEVGQRALEVGKPIIVWKSGNTKTGRQAAASHTASLTASCELYKSAFKHGGFIEVRDVSDFVDIVQAFRPGRLPRGRNVAIITTSGGAGVVLADHCEEYGLVLPSIPDSVDKLRSFLPGFAGFGNPLDLTAQGQNDPESSPHNRVLKVLLGDPAIDQVILRNGNVHGAAGENWSRELIHIAGHSEKPIMVSWGIVIDSTDKVANALRAGKVPCYSTPLRLVAAMAAITEFAHKKQRYDSRLRSRTSERPVPSVPLRIPKGVLTLGEHMSKEVLSAYGIPTVREILLDPDAVERLSGPPIQFPVALKIESPDIPHKTEACALRLGINSLPELKEAAGAIVDSACRFKPGARINGVLIQEMADGIEVIAGVVNDKYFGPTVMLGLGGVFAELLHDVTYRFAPFDKNAALEMISDIKGGRILAGYRGQPAADVEALAECLSRLSWLASDHVDKIAEVDINPLFVRPAGHGVAAADALIVLAPDWAR